MRTSQMAQKIGFCVLLLCGLSLVSAQTTIGDFTFTVTANTLPSTMKLSSAYFRPNSGSVSQPAPIYLQAMSDNTLRMGWTGTDGKAHFSAFDSTGARVTASEHTVTATELRGMFAHSDGSKAMFIWDSAATSLYLQKYNSANTQLWSTQLESDRAVDFQLGGSDVVYGRDPYSTAYRYQLYYKVHGTAASCWSGSDGHEGDSLKIVDDAGTATMVYCWGLSHSMNNFLSFNSALNRTLLAGATDCFPGSPNTTFPIGSLRLVQYPSATGGLGSGNLATTNVKNVYANCGGQYGGDVGRPLAVSGGFLVPIYAPNVVITAAGAFSGNYDIGIVRVTPGASATAAWVSSSITWLTSTTENELYPQIAPWTNGNYLIAFARNVAGTYKTFMGVIDSSFAWVSNPVDVSSTVAIGERHGFVVYPNGDLGWAYPWGTSPAVTYSSASANLKVVRLSPSSGSAPTSASPAPKAAPVAAPKAAPLAAPVAAPKSAPVSAPKAAPVAVPTAVSSPKAAPVAAPKAAPVAVGSAPKAAPVANGPAPTASTAAPAASTPKAGNISPVASTAPVSPVDVPQESAPTGSAGQAPTQASGTPQRSSGPTSNSITNGASRAQIGAIALLGFVLLISAIVA